MRASGRRAKGTRERRRRIGKRESLVRGKAHCTRQTRTPVRPYGHNDCRLIYPLAYRFRPVHHPVHRMYRWSDQRSCGARPYGRTGGRVRARRQKPKHGPFTLTKGDVVDFSVAALGPTWRRLRRPSQTVRCPRRPSTPTALRRRARPTTITTICTQSSRRSPSMRGRSLPGSDSLARASNTSRA